MCGTHHRFESTDQNITKLKTPGMFFHPFLGRLCVSGSDAHIAASRPDRTPEECPDIF